MVPWLMVLHVGGVVLWTAGMLGAGWTHAERLHCADSALAGLERRFLYLAAHGGMALTLLSGGATLALNPSFYMGEWWLRVKLAFVSGLVVLTAAQTAALRSRRPAAWSWLFLAGAAAVLSLVLVKPV